jgi:hypothetical protein
MKKIFLLGAFTLLSTTIFSCTADDIETENSMRAEVEKNTIPVETTPVSYADDGPGDQVVIIYPPKKK